MRQSLELQGDQAEVATEERTPSRRHRSSAQIRLDGGPPTLLERGEPFALPSELGSRLSRPASPGGLTRPLRTALWRVVANALFAPGSIGCLRRVWASPALGGAADRIPDDVAELIEDWFSLVEPADVYAFIDAVAEHIEPPFRPGFVAAVNSALEEGLSDHRFVARRLAPISAKADIASIERAFAICKAVRWTFGEAHLHEAVAFLAQKPQPNADAAIREAVRAVELAASTLTSTTQALDDNLELLEARGYIARTLKNAYQGLFTYVTNGARRATTDDARLVVVMCAGFVSHLATHSGHVAQR